MCAKKIIFKIACLAFAVLLYAPSNLYAQVQEKTATENSSWANDPITYLILGVVIILLSAIYALSKSAIALGKLVAKANKKSSATIIFILLCFHSFSQNAEPMTRITEIPEWAVNPSAYIIGFLFLILLLTVYVLSQVNLKLIKILNPEPERIESGFTNTVKKPSLLRRIYLRLVDSVPVTEEKDILLDHDYDGIKELDNNLPPWWKYGFYLTIVFGIFYLLIYHVSGTGKLQADEYKEELRVAALAKEERMKASAENITDENVVTLIDADRITKGKEAFQKLCAACHRNDGGGQVGPNLTDEFWLHGGGIKNIFKTITYGVPAKGMISWQSQLSPKQIQEVSSYILTLKGTNPPAPKEPQGDKWLEEVAATNSTKQDTASIAILDTLKK